jgi:hypothetical protein
MIIIIIVADIFGFAPGLGGRIAANCGLVPLEVIKAKAALHVSDWDLDEVRAC